MTNTKWKSLLNYFKIKIVPFTLFSFSLAYLFSLYWCLQNKFDHYEFNNPKSANVKTWNFTYVLQHPQLDRLQNIPRLSDSYIQDHQNEDVLFFNRVPKTGSEMVVLLLQWLQKKNNFKHIRLKNTKNRFLNREQQLQLAADVGEQLNDSAERLVSFDRHVHFTNFTQIGLKMPLLVNIIRDPVDKIVSRFYYARATPRPGAYTPPGHVPKVVPTFTTIEECLRAKAPECTYVIGQNYDLTIPYFCGHQSYCRELGNVAALLKAKRNVEDWYSAVGILEDVNTTFSVLEDKLPKFFKGVTELYYQELHGFHQNKNRQKPSDLDLWARRQLEINLTLENDFYKFVKQRLKMHFEAISKRN